MGWKKLKRIEKIIVLAALSMAVMMIGYFLFKKRPNRDIFLSRDLDQGWITIRYQVPDAPPLPIEGGRLQLHIPPKGVLETSDRLSTGWGRDEFFWEDGTPIPSHINTDPEPAMYLFEHQYRARSFEDLLPSLPVGTDTVLWDGTEIEIPKSGRVEYQVGRKTLEYFYYSPEPLPISFIPPKRIDSEAIESLEDKSIPINDPKD